MHYRKIKVLFDTVQGYDILFDGQKMREDDKILEFIESIPEFEELCEYTADVKVIARAEAPKVLQSRVKIEGLDFVFYQGPLTNGQIIISGRTYLLLMDMWRRHFGINVQDFEYAIPDRTIENVYYYEGELDV